MACFTHPDVDEKRSCSSCETLWCLACVRKVGLSNREVCIACGHELRKAAAPQTATASIADAVRRAISLEGLATSASLAVCFALSGWLGIFILFHLAGLVAYYFTVIHHVGDGQDGLPGPSDVTGDWVATVNSVTRGMVCIALGALPLVLRWKLSATPPSTASVLVLLVIGQAYMPAALLTIAFSNNVLAVLWPFSWAKIIARAPLPYARFVGIWLVSVAFGLALFLVTMAALGGFGVLGAFAMAIVWNMYWIAQAALVGNFIRMNSAAFGWD